MMDYDDPDYDFYSEGDMDPQLASLSQLCSQARRPLMTKRVSSPYEENQLHNFVNNGYKPFKPRE